MSSMIERIGEMFMVGFYGTDPNAASDLIRRYHVGGIILFSRNFRSASHLKEMNERLQQLRREVSDSPLFIAIDQEGGCVARITDGVTVFPGNMALGALDSDDLARQVGEVTGAELASLGINVNFAPVLDINSNPENPGVGARAFGSDPVLAARLGAAMIHGIQQNGILAAAKHFPGLGEAEVDSHDELPVVKASTEKLEARELTPFRAAIEADVGFIMTAHCAYPSLDRARYPATLSQSILSALLRDRLGFRGIIITDCLEMGAIEKNYTASQSAPMAVRAGANMLLICHTFEKQVGAIESLAQALHKGDISKKNVDASLSIIAELKKRIHVSPGKIVPRKLLSEDIAARAITIYGDARSTLPLTLAPSDTLAVVVPAFEALTKVEESAEPHELFLREIKRRHKNLIYCKAPVQPTEAEITECVKQCGNADVLLLLTYNLHLYEAQRNLAHALLRLAPRTIAAAVRDPYDLAHLSGASGLIATYSFRECSLKGLVRVLFGEFKAQGRLPVEFPQYHEK
ncbi:MAG: beta-N-acetylhexosaminidase [Candidatus Abyssubacteria bacterium]